MIANVAQSSLAPGLGEMIVKGLAVAGGVAVGAFLSGAVVRLVVRFMTTRQVPRGPLLLIRLLGAAAGGLAVWMFVFGSGGWGLGGAGWGLGGGGDSATTRNQGDQAVSTPQQQRPPATPERGLRIVVIGGERYKKLLNKNPKMEGHFYQVDGDDEPRDRAQIRELIDKTQEKRDQQKKTPLQLLEIVINPDDTSAIDQPVRDLKQLAADKKLTVQVTESGGRTP
jgi:hypothetical protein